MTIYSRDHAHDREPQAVSVDELVASISRGEVPDDLRGWLQKYLDKHAKPRRRKGRPKEWPDTLAWVDPSGEYAAQHPALVAALDECMRIGEDPRVKMAREVEAERRALKHKGKDAPKDRALKKIARKYGMAQGTLRNLIRGVPLTPL